MIAQFSRLVVVAAAITVAVSIGCQKKDRESQGAAAAASKQATPEESFESIVEMFRRGVEDIPIGFRVDDGSGGRTLMTGRNVVTHQLIPPGGDGDTYRAEITVESQSEYSLQRSNTSSASQPATSDAQPAADGSDFQSLDPSQASSPGAGTASSAKGDKSAVTVARNEEKDMRTYKLVYENGRWKLVSKLDPNTEGSIKFAFERALASQG